MLVYVDEQPFETKLEPDSTVNELLEEVRASLGGAERLVMEIRADGLDVTGDEYGDTLGKLLKSFGRYDFVTADPRQVVGSALSECQDLLANAADKRTEAIELFTKGDNNMGIGALGGCFRAWQQVHQAICDAMGLLKIDPATLMIEGKALTVVLGDALDQLREVREALVAQDFVLVSDILQYEFDTIIQSWQSAINTILQATAGAPERASAFTHDDSTVNHPQ